MKKILISVLGLGLGSAVLLNSVYGSYQTSGKQKVKSSNSKFTGIWHGAEKCNITGAPVAILPVVASKPSGLTLSGIYSIQGKVTATVSGNSIIIPRQEVKDPNFTNLLIEGELVLSAKGATLGGKITVVNNQTTDECEVQYSK